MQIKSQSQVQTSSLLHLLSPSSFGFEFCSFSCNFLDTTAALSPLANPASSCPEFQFQIWPAMSLKPANNMQFFQQLPADFQQQSFLFSSNFSTLSSHRNRAEYSSKNSTQQQRITKQNRGEKEEKIRPAVVVSGGCTTLSSLAGHLPLCLLSFELPAAPSPSNNYETPPK